MIRSLCARHRKGFTLLELMIALVLVAGVLVGLNTFVFSMSELWVRNRDWRLFDQHVRAVTRFLEHELRQGALPPSVVTGTRSVEAQEVAVAFGRDRKSVV